MNILFIEKMDFITLAYAAFNRLFYNKIYYFDETKYLKKEKWTKMFSTLAVHRLDYNTSPNHGIGWEVHRKLFKIVDKIFIENIEDRVVFQKVKEHLKLSPFYRRLKIPVR